ncbi:hypothetical protein BZA70DRAFT_289173 [Myxozyma melibiosi]|uniref:PQ-loop repeat-containing protein 1 n=1 Tax=Myxozyma melibiosi TaxID=54550 RepID=A0ABR1F8A8_9ASCO
MSANDAADIVILGIPLNYIIAAFLTSSPITSYADQMFYVWRRKSSDGFALDTCALLIAVSTLRIFFWFGRDLELPIFLQSCSMLGVQLIYLKLALMYMPAAWRRAKSMEDVFIPFKRPFYFWQWKSDWKFYLCIAIFMGTLALLQFLLRSFDTWFLFIERLAVALEAFIPLPQLILNYTRHSLSGFRFTLLFAWVSGDFVKTLFYYINGEAYYYQIGGTCQTLLDCGILAQYVYYWRKKRLESKRQAELEGLEVEELSLNETSISADETSALLANEEAMPRASIESNRISPSATSTSVSSSPASTIKIEKQISRHSDFDGASVSSAAKNKAAENLV